MSRFMCFSLGFLLYFLIKHIARIDSDVKYSIVTQKKINNLEGKLL